MSSSSSEPSLSMSQSEILSSSSLVTPTSSSLQTQAQSILLSSGETLSSFYSSSSSIMVLSSSKGSNLEPTTSNSAVSQQTSTDETTTTTYPTIVNPAVPTGASLVSDIFVRDNSTNSVVSYKEDIFTISVRLDSVEPIEFGTKSQFSIPEFFYGFNDKFLIYTTDGQLVASVTADEDSNIFTMTFDGEWITTSENIRGTFTFNARLRYTVAAVKRSEVSVLITYPMILPAVFVTPDNQFTTYLEFQDDKEHTSPAEIGNGDYYVVSGNSLDVQSSSNPIVRSSSSGSELTLRTSDTVQSQTSIVCSQSSSSISPTNFETVTEVKNSTTTVTVTSCSGHSCTTSVTVATGVQTIIKGKTITYSTYADNPRTTAKVSTETQNAGGNLNLNYSNEGTSKTAVTRRIVTTTVSGSEVVYTTYCPLTESYTSGAPREVSKIASAINENTLSQKFTATTTATTLTSQITSQTSTLANGAETTSSIQTVNAYDSAASRSRISFFLIPLFFLFFV